MLEYWVDALGFLIVGLASGGIASFLVRTDLPLSWIAVAGVLGTAAEPWVPLRWGPELFDHCLLTSIAASVVAIYAFWLLRLVYRTLS
jgi:uncharacterized membrane protein YeaQ/YmgE (transglycosylase-associated protein family)